MTEQEQWAMRVLGSPGDYTEAERLEALAIASEPFAEHGQMITATGGRVMSHDCGPGNRYKLKYDSGAAERTGWCKDECRGYNYDVVSGVDPPQLILCCHTADEAKSYLTNVMGVVFPQPDDPRYGAVMEQLSRDLEPPPTR